MRPCPPGVGKTRLAIALAVKACQCGFSVYFTTLDDLVKNLAAAIPDRLLHHSHVISIRGQSYRLRDKLTQAAATPPLPTTLEPAGSTAKGGNNQS